MLNELLTPRTQVITTTVTTKDGTKIAARGTVLVQPEILPEDEKASYADRFVARDNVTRTEEEVPALEPVQNSSALHGVLYVGTRQVLYVHFKKGGNVYRYAKVTKAMFEGIMSGEFDPKQEGSVTRSLNAVVVDADKHPCTHIAKKYEVSNYTS